MGLELVGSKNFDSISIENSSIKWVDISEDDKGDYLAIKNSTTDNGRNVLPTDELDHIKYRHRGNLIKDKSDFVGFDSEATGKEFPIIDKNKN